MFHKFKLTEHQVDYLWLHKYKYLFENWNLWGQVLRLGQTEFSFEQEVQEKIMVGNLSDYTIWYGNVLQVLRNF